MESQILMGDCAETLKALPSESVDCIITDPPYGYKFMNVSWDKALPSLEALKECCRVLKSGAFAFFMSAPRQDVLSRMIVRLEEAGFQTGFTSVYFCYASGFPKAAAIDKLIDKRNGRNFNPDVKNYLNLKRKEKELSFNQINEMLGTATNGGGVASSLMGDKQYNELPTLEIYSKLKVILGLDSRFDALIEREEAEREVISTKRKINAYADGGGYVSGVGTFSETDINYTAPATEQAKQFEGSFVGFNPKPAVEVIIVCMKSLNQKTYVDQALANGKGVTWLGDCKIPYTSDTDKESARYGSQADITGGNLINPHGVIAKNVLASEEGRFPANLLVSDDILNDGSNHKSGSMSCVAKRENAQVYGKFNPKEYEITGLEGSFSRYFDLDAWFKSKLPEQAQKTYPFMVVPKPSKSEKNRYCENKHPTVKPLKLMSYLITMGSREGDLILDPFAGSGTTLEAARLLNRKFVGCELTEEYLNVLEARAGVKATQCPYRNLIEVTEQNELSIDEMERSLSDAEREKYEDLLIETPYEVFDIVRKAYWMGKGVKVC